MRAFGAFWEFGCGWGLGAAALVTRFKFAEKPEGWHDGGDRASAMYWMRIVGGCGCNAYKVV